MENKRQQFVYKSCVQIVVMTPAELVAYKKAMLVHSKLLLGEAADWKATYKLLQQEINDRLLELEAGLIEAELDRIESLDNNNPNGYTFDTVGYIH